MKKNGVIFFLILVKGYAQDTPLFEYVPSRTSHLNFTNTLIATETENFFLYDNFYQGAGVAVGDVNNDGLLDIYLCGNQVKDQLYLNKGSFVFENITQKSGIANYDVGWSSSVSMVDINNDGLLDIYVTKELYDDKPEWRRNKLYLNQGNATFIEVAQKVGLGDTTRSRGAAFFDYDLDGDLDVFILRQPPNPGLYSKYKAQSDQGELLSEAYAPRLYENKEGLFYDVSSEAGVIAPSYANAVSVADVDKDGYPDIIVANDFEAPDAMYINQGNKTFKNTSNSAFRHTSYYSMGIDIADLNNDLLPDVFIVDMAANDNFRLKSNMSGMKPSKFWDIVHKGWNYQYMYNALQLNNGNGTFSEIGQLAGMSSTDWSWSPLIGDFDNDGYKDVFVTNGILRDIRNTDADLNIKRYISKKIQDYLKTHGHLNYKSIWEVVNYKEMAEIFPSTKMQNMGFKNSNGFEFKQGSTNWGINKKTFSSGAAYGDFDNDGDLDLVINNVNEKAQLLKNNSNHNFLRVSLKDSTNSPTLGAKTTLYYNNGKHQYAESTTARGMFSASEPIVHFGLGNIPLIDSLKVVWPNQKTTVLRAIKSNQTIVLYMNKASDTHQKEKQGIALFSEITNRHSIKFKHQENRFDDYTHQVLLPHKMSELGPALDVADVNKDGLDDVFVGGAFGQPAALFIQTSKGDFTRRLDDLWEQEKDYEDVDALFVDINNDGYKDLYVVSGGNAYQNGDLHYTDRLYLNNGSGHFYKGTIDNNAPISGSVVKAVDYDKDGDLDLFIGGRHLPHQYPLPVSSMILKNDNGRLINQTTEIAPELNSIGMVTDAVWADYDSDGNIDLILVGEWMPITVFKNSKGQLVKVPLDDLKATSGWWFSLEKGDFDNDGDIDFIAGNLGLNHKYKTSEKRPFDIYYSDFDKNGKGDLVLGYYNESKHYPLRGFSCSAQQVPGLKKEIKGYNLFASLELEEVYGKSNLQKALHYTADTFASSYMENLGDGRFKISALPIQAQVSNSNDFLIKDFNKDGNIDVLVVNNCFGFEIETPRHDSGNGLMMLGDGKGGFLCKAASKTGLFINKDAKKIKMLKQRNDELLLIGNNNASLQVIKIE